MPTLPEHDNFHAHFHRRWGHLNDPHVRTLAWLLDAPDLLDPAAPEWEGRVATLGPPAASTRDWLAELDRAPEALHSFLGLQRFTRLGRYAENLLAYYLQHEGRLVAHGVQVRVNKGETVGEFDFLLDDGGRLLHWEFATKLYLLETEGNGHQADYFVGPNLADTLGAKVRKIMERQLALSRHPAAQASLPRPVAGAQALVKGWLFYHGQASVRPGGVSDCHCRGFWCTRDEFRDITGAQAVRPLQRLEWLAPVTMEQSGLADRAALDALLDTHFAEDGAPLMVALLAPQDGMLVEVERGFVVSNDWRRRAAERVSIGGARH